MSILRGKPYMAIIKSIAELVPKAAAASGASGSAIPGIDYYDKALRIVKEVRSLLELYNQTRGGMIMNNTRSIREKSPQNEAQPLNKPPVVSYQGNDIQELMQGLINTLVIAENMGRMLLFHYDFTDIFSTQATTNEFV